MTLPNPKSRKEQYLAKAAGMSTTIPEKPESREEQYLEAIANNGGGGGGGGTKDFDQLNNRPKYNNTTMDSTTNIPEVKTYTAGTNITIDASNKISATDTTYNDFVGTDGTSAGTAGLVPAPATTDTGKFLKSDGTWDTAGGGSSTLYDTPGTNTDGAMTQKATTSMVFADPATRYKVQIGSATTSSDYGIGIGYGAGSYSDYAIAIGYGASAYTANGVAIGRGARSNQQYGIAILGATTAIHGISIGSGSIGGSQAASYGAIAIGINASAAPTGVITDAIALGRGAVASRQGELNIADETWTTAAFNGTKYRLISGVYDGQGLHDAATVAQGNTLATAAPTTSTEGVLGQLYTDTTNMHTYQLGSIDETDPSNPVYNWVQRW